MEPAIPVYQNTIPEPALVLKQNSHLLPVKGHALDLASGLGGNAMYMANKGLTVNAWDLSPVALRKLNHLAQSENLTIHSEVRDIIQDPPSPDSFDVIVVSYFLERSINQLLINALKPSGLLFCQTYTSSKISKIGPTNPDYLLEENELLTMFNELKVRVYREEKICGDTKKGLRNEALYVGEKVGEKIK